VAKTKATIALTPRQRKFLLRLGERDKPPPKPRPERGKGQKTLMSDEKVLECRRRWEQETGWTIRRLAKEYGVSDDYMRDLIGYRVRSKLVPKPPR
jgi:hypothetical protein